VKQLNKFINVDRIEFVVTYRCNSHCKHCQIGQDKRESSPVAVDAELAVQIVDGVAQAYSPQSVMTFGGEPLLFPDTVCAIHAAAKANQVDRREVITNAGWPRSEDEFRAVAFKLSDSGVTDIAISVDCFHQEHIPLAVVERNVQSLLDAGIARLGWNPCWVISKEHRNPWNRRTNSILRTLAHLPVPESYGNVVQPAGNALVWLHDVMPSKTSVPTGSCEDMPYAGRLDRVGSISVEPDSSIAVCKEFAIGNAGQSDIVEMLRSYDPYGIPEMKAILQGGIAQLARLAFGKGVKADPEGYYSICDMCISLRRKLAKLGVTPR
jgi:hypothetical protein